jgi:hypothetical protein
LGPGPPARTPGTDHGDRRFRAWALQPEHVDGGLGGHLVDLELPLAGLEGGAARCEDGHPVPLAPLIRTGVGGVREDIAEDGSAPVIVEEADGEP